MLIVICEHYYDKLVFQSNDASILITSTYEIDELDHK